MLLHEALGVPVQDLGQAEADLQLDGAGGDGPREVAADERANGFLHQTFDGLRKAEGRTRHSLSCFISSLAWLRTDPRQLQVRVAGPGREVAAAVT